MIHVPNITDVNKAIAEHRVAFGKKLKTLANVGRAVYPVHIVQYFDGDQWINVSKPTPAASFDELVAIMADGRFIHQHAGWSLFFKDADGGRYMPDIWAREFNSIPTIHEISN